jgi:hypothetical protein
MENQKQVTLNNIATLTTTLSVLNGLTKQPYVETAILDVVSKITELTKTL